MLTLRQLPLYAAVLLALAGSAEAPPASAQSLPARDGEIFAGGLGRYQLTHMMLGDIGWISADGIWSERAHKRKIASIEDFLTTPHAQDLAFNELFRKHVSRLKQNGSMKHIGQEYVAPRLGRFTVTEYGISAAAHLLGTLRTKEVLEKLQLREQDKSVSLTPEEDRAVKRMRDFSEIPNEKLQ